MTSISEGNNLGDLLKYEASNLYSREEIIVAKGQNLKLGTVVGCDKDNVIKIINPTATDGTQTAIGVIKRKHQSGNRYTYSDASGSCSCMVSKYN